MGTPNNQQTPKTEREILIAALVSSGMKIDEASLRQTGLDIDAAEVTYQQSVRPYLDYLHGYRKLEDHWDPSTYTPDSYTERRSGRMTREKTSIEDQAWRATLASFGQLARHRQVLEVTFARFEHFIDPYTPKYIRCAVYLTRDGQWLLWFVGENHQSPQALYEGHLGIYDDLRSMLDDALTRIGTVYRPGYTNFSTQRHHLPLSVEDGLRQILHNTIAERERRLFSLKLAYDDASKRSAHFISFG